MQNKNYDIKNFSVVGVKSIQDYILLVRTNLSTLLIISVFVIIVFAVYAFFTPDIFRSTVSLKITGQPKTVLHSEPIPESSTMANDRFIANEIEVILNSDTRDKVVKALIDTFENADDKSKFKLLAKSKGSKDHKAPEEIAGLLRSAVKAEQKAGMDIVDISVEMKSPVEAAIIANTYADQYRKINLDANRYQFTSLRVFLEKQCSEKLAELNIAENELTNFKEKGGIVALDAQSSLLITQLSQLDAQKDAAKIDLMSSNGALEQYKKQLNNQDPSIANYLKGQTSQAYIEALQKQIAELQMNRDMAVNSKNNSLDISVKIKDYDQKINDLQQKLNSKVNEIKSGAISSSPNQIRELTQKLIEEEIKNHSLSIKMNELQRITNQYESALNRMPKKTMDFAAYQRNMESLQQLYTLLQQKYQEAVINELSQPGNSIIVTNARVPDEPVKPNRILIVLMGLLIGPAVSFFYLLIKDFFDDTVKTPDDIEDNNISFLSWIPHTNFKIKEQQSNGLLIPYESDASINESFRTIKARIQFTNSDSLQPKVILVTSPAEGEGKSFVSFNLAGNFSQSEKKTLLIDGDIRRPKLHTMLRVDKKPGLIDYLCHRAQLEDIIRLDKKHNLNYITAGSSVNSMQVNPAEIFASKAMNILLMRLREYFDVIIIDSAPIVAVIDTEILAKLVDGAILIISADKTKNQLMKDAIEIINRNNCPFIGTVLNNFKYKSGYGYYFKYYYNYSSHANGNKSKV